MGNKFLVVGTTETCLDMKIKQLPFSAETLTENDGTHLLCPGGNALFYSKLLSEHGCDVKLCTCLGRDRYRDMLLSYYKDARIPTEFVHTEPDMQTAFRVRMTESNGMSREIFYPGASAAIKSTAIEEACETCPDIVLCDADLPPEKLAFLSSCCEEKGTPVFFDATGVSATVALKGLERCEMFVCGANEANKLTSIKPETMDSCLKAAVRLASIVSSKYYLIKLGERGFYIYDGKYFVLVANFARDGGNDEGVSKAVFFSALAYAYNEYGDPEKACKYASAAFAVSSGSAGNGISAVPTENRIKRILRENGVLRD